MNKGIYDNDPDFPTGKVVVNPLELEGIMLILMYAGISFALTFYHQDKDEKTFIKFCLSIFRNIQRLGPDKVNQDLFEMGKKIDSTLGEEK